MDGAAMDLDVGSSEDEGNNDEQYASHRLGYNPQVQNGGYDPQLENVRMESIRKIKGRFEHIYQKYGKDFDGVADEIDMATGVIVVNNGHLQNMEHEVDAGNGDALALSRTFEDDEDEEDGDGSSGSDSEVDVAQDGGNDSNSISSDHPELDFSWQDDTAASLTSPDEDGDTPSNPAQEIADAPSTPTNNSKRRKRKERTIDVPSEEDTASDDIFGQMSGLKDSMLALQDKYKNGQDMAPDDIQALGMTIANQLASFITGGKASKKRKRPSLPNRFESVGSSRGRRRNRSHSPVDPVAPTPARSPGAISLWAPLHRPRGQGTPKKKQKTPPNATAAESAAAGDEADDSLIDSFVLQTIMDQSALEPDELQGPTTVRCCSHCKTTETKLWRRGPKAVDLCNNCGMYYYRYGLMRALHTSPSTEQAPPPEDEEEDLDPRHKSALYSANTSRPLDGINLFGLHFSVREDAQIIKLKEIDRLTWDQIAMQHPGRTPFALQCRYSKMLAGKPCEARDILSSRGYQFYVDADGHTVARQMGDFTEEENDMVLKLREEEGFDWDGIALELPGRTAEDVEKRYDEMVAEHLGRNRDAKISSAKPKHKSKTKKLRRNRSASERSRGRYTPIEDDAILKLREDDRLSWQDVAKQMPGRTLGSVQRRYSRDIGPYGRSRSSTPRGSPAPDEAPPRLRKYTAEEDATLMRLRDEEELGWEEIAEQMPERSASSLLGRYYYKIRKDDSRDSSRASSVASSSRRRRSGSLPAVDLEARFDDAQDETFSEGENFTEAEDSLIVNLRELECLSWDQIAAEMPGRDVSSISCRYYQYLLPRKVPEIRGAGQTLDPALQSGSFGTLSYTDPGADAETRLQEKDDQVSARTRATSAGTSVASRAGTVEERSSTRKRKSDVLPQGRSVAGRRSDAPMLRRALQKNLNRQSESHLVRPVDLPFMSMGMDGANDDVLVDGDELSAGHIMPGEPELLPSALPVDFEMQPPTSGRKLRSSSKRKSAYPETPLRGANGPYPSSGPTPLDPGLYFTPSRYQNQSHPYFLANAASLEEPPAPVFPNKKARVEPGAVVSGAHVDELEEGVAFEDGKRSSRKRGRAPKPTRAARPRQLQFDDADEEEEDFEGDDDDDNAGEYFNSRKKKGANKAKKSFRGRIPAAGNTNGDDEVEVVAARTRGHSTGADDETEEEDIDMPDLGTDEDDDNSASESEEEEDDDELRCKPKERMPIFDPRDTIEEAKHKKRGRANKITNSTIAAKAGDGNTMDVLDTEMDVSAIPPEHLVRPDISWSQLNFMALKSRAPEPMLTRDIYAYLEAHWPFFRICKGHWRDSIRGNLSTRPEFVKHSAEDKAALWRLADPNSETIWKPKGDRRGRGLTGVARPPKAKEPHVPRKKGRRTNASKGLPLKRIYKRTYVRTAAETKRLAAVEAAAAGGDPQNAGLEGYSTPPVDGAAHPPADADLEATVSLPAAETSAHIRPARQSTIGDSDAGEQFEFVACPPNLPGDGTTEVKLEPQLPEPTFIAPVANMTSDINRDPESSDGPTIPNSTDTSNEIRSDNTPISVSTGRAGLRSSSPALVSTGRRLSRTYGKATPSTARSTLFKQVVPASGSSALKATPAFAKIARTGSRAGTPSSLRRTVQTPVRETVGSEDELA